MGELRDALVTDETNQNNDWNGVWDARTAMFDGGWAVEVVIPFKTLRYQAGPNQVWGVNMRRILQYQNEWSFLAPIPAFLMGQGSIRAVSFAGTMVGLEVPPPGLNLEIKPYGITDLRTDRNASSAFTNEASGDYGVDVKYGITKSLTLDLTYNTDFAQVEDDQQQINLTRFNLFFPEKREFFLEGRDIFAFGRATGRGNTPVLFFSRQIGLESGQSVPIVGGARMTGKTGPYSVGLLNIQSDDDVAADARATNFSVVRVKRDILRRSVIGAIYTRRQETGPDGAEPGETFGVDALYSSSRSLYLNGYYAKTQTPGLSGDDTSHLARLDYNADRYGLQLEQLGVEANFIPQIGFLRRTDFLRRFALVRFSPRPARTRMPAVRRFIYQGSVEYLENGQGRRDWQEIAGRFGIELQSSDQLNVEYTRDYEFIPQEFAIAPGIIVPVGGYDYENGSVSYRLGTQHTFSGTVAYEYGSLYGGTRQTFRLSSGRLAVPPHLTFEPTVSTNWVRLPQGRFTSTVVGNRTTLTVTPRMFISALLQYNSRSRSLSTNARLRWEYTPGSELFVVYSESRDTQPESGHFSELQNRAFIIKLTRLLRF